MLLALVLKLMAVRPAEEAVLRFLAVTRQLRRAFPSMVVLNYMVELNCWREAGAPNTRPCATRLQASGTES